MQAVPLDAVRQAWRDLMERGVSGLRVVQIPMPEGRAVELAREASQKYARLAGEFAQWKADEQRTVNWLDALGRRIRRFSRRKFL